MKKLKVVVDCDIPFIKGVLEPYSIVSYLKGDAFNSNVISNAQALIIRTRTKCNKELLQGTAVKAIFSATIGCDHIDLEYCTREGIAVFNAAGCNANGVVQYVVTTLFALVQKRGLILNNKTIGIIGAGNVGERLALLLEKLGLSVLRCDPPKSRITNTVPYYSLDYVLGNSHVITLHVPLNSETRNICSYDFIGKMKNGAILINSSRGEVVDEAAVIESQDKLGGLIVDVWKNEPNIDKEFLNVTDIATTHIAGYSLEGKINATVMSVLSFANFFSIKELENFHIEAPLFEEIALDSFFYSEFSITDKSTYFSKAVNLLLHIFPVWEQDLMLKANPDGFERIRSEYIYRRELPWEVISKLEKLNLFI